MSLIKPEIIVIAIVVIVSFFIVITGSAAVSGSGMDYPQTASCKFTSGFPFFFSQVNILETSYLSGNSDFGSGQQNSVYIEPSTDGSTGNNPVSDSQSVLNPQSATGGATAGNSGSESRSGLNSEPVTGSPAGNSVAAIAENTNSNKDVSSITSQLGTDTNADTQYQGVQSASSELKKIPSWIFISCLGIDAIVSLLLLTLALMKKI